MVQFTTRRYRDNPLVVQGPGAGPEVTAAGVFADLLRGRLGAGSEAVTRATAFAPASIGNVAVGFDVLGQSLEGPADRATVALTGDGAVRITAIRGAW